MGAQEGTKKLVEHLGSHIGMLDSLQGTEISADSFGQGLLEHNRAHLAWLEEILKRYPDLVFENCGSGGGRMDYVTLSRFQIQSMTDHEDYLKLPMILVGASAAVLPEQLAIWEEPRSPV
jgi:alpha-galactosidase